MVTILATRRSRRQTSTDVRDNASLRVCFGVQSSLAAAAVLGDEWRSDNFASPLGAPTGVGVAAIDGRFTRFRAPYIPESVVAAHMKQCAGLRQDPADLLAVQLASGQ